MVFIVLPFTHVSVLTATFFVTGIAEAEGDGATSFSFSCVNFILIVGDEKVKFLALNDIQPFCLVTDSVAMS